MTHTLTRLMGSCYADHVDSHLVSKGLPKLSTLQQDENFATAYQKVFLDPNSVDEQVEHDAVAGESNPQRKLALRRRGLLSRLKNKLSIPPKVMRMISIAIAVSLIGFLIWVLVAHGATMSGGQLVLSIINIVLEVAIVIVEIFSLISSQRDRSYP